MASCAGVWFLAPDPADKHTDHFSESTNLLIHETLVFDSHRTRAFSRLRPPPESPCVSRDPSGERGRPPTQHTHPSRRGPSRRLPEIDSPFSLPHAETTLHESTRGFA